MAVEDVPGRISPSGVFIADEFRANLIIDRYDPIFADMRASKLKHLRSVNSEDAVTWNVFRSLRQVASIDWLPTAWALAFPTVAPPHDFVATVELWQSVRPPRSLVADGDEGPSEIDCVIEGSSWVWFIEAKYGSDISTGTTTRPDRDQILRNLDVGTYYAGVRQFFFSLLIRSAAKPSEGTRRIERYGNSASVAALLPHRQDGLRNLAAVGLLTWADMASVLEIAAASARRDDERSYAGRARDWLRQRGIA